MNDSKCDIGGLKRWTWILSAACVAVWLAGCGAHVEQQKAEQAQAMEKLREENKEVQKLRAENKELPRLRADKEELPKLRGTTDEIERLRKDNARIQGEIADLAKTQKERLLAAQQARAASALPVGPGGANAGGPAGISAALVDDPNVPREGDEILIDPKFLGKLLPQYDWSKLERKEPLAVRALLEQQGIVLTNYQQLITLGVTNYVIQHGPRPPPPPQ